MNPVFPMLTGKKWDLWCTCIHNKRIS